MDAHEHVAGQVLLDFLHAQQHDDGFALVVTSNPQVLAHGLDVADAVDGDANDLVVTLDKDDAVVIDLGGDDSGSLLAYLVDVPHLECGGFKLVKTVGLQQVSHGIGLIALDGIVGVGRGEYHNGATAVFLIERFGKLHAVEFGHVDVKEDGINLLVVNDMLGLNGALALCHEFEVGNLLDIGYQLLEGQRFIIDCNTFNHSFLVFSFVCSLEIGFAAGG